MISLIAATVLAQHQYDARNFTPHYDGMATVIAQSTHHGIPTDAGPPEAVLTLALTKSAVSVLTTMPAGFSAPVWVWDARTPTVAVTGGNLEMDAGAMPSAVPTPFCFSGGAIDTEDPTDCLQAIPITTGVRIKTSDNKVWAGTDRTVCAIARIDPAPDANNAIWTHRASGGAGEGLVLYQADGTGMRLSTVNNVPTTVTATHTTSALAGQWDLVCGVVDIDGNTTVVGTTATPASSASPANLYTGLNTPFGVGAYVGSATLNGEVDIAAIWVWDAAFTEAQIREFQRWILLGGEQPDDTPPTTYTTSGAIACLMDGQWTEFADNILPIGCAAAYGSTTNYGLLVTDEITVQNTYSVAINSGWTETGTAVVTTSDLTSPWSDGRAWYKITDDDAAGAEYISTTITRSTPTKWRVAIDAQETGGSDAAIDVQIKEQTGASCTPTTATKTALAATASLARYEFTHTVSDTDCTELVFDVGCTDGSGDMLDVAEQCHLSTMIQIFSDASTQVNTGVPLILIESSGATATAGKMALIWLDSLTSTAQTPANGIFYYDATLTPAAAPFLLGTSSQTLFQVVTGTSTQGVVADTTATVEYRINGSGASWGSWSAVVGTAVAMQYRVRYPASHTIYADSVSVGTGTTEMTRYDGIDTLAIGSVYSTGASQTLGLFFKNFVVTVDP